MTVRLKRRFWGGFPEPGPREWRILGNLVNATGGEENTQPVTERMVHKSLARCGSRRYS